MAPPATERTVSHPTLGTLRFMGEDGILWTGALPGMEGDERNSIVVFIKGSEISGVEAAQLSRDYGEGQGPLSTPEGRAMARKVEANRFAVNLGCLAILVAAMAWVASAAVHTQPLWLKLGFIGFLALTPLIEVGFYFASWRRRQD